MQVALKPEDECKDGFCDFENCKNETKITIMLEDFKLRICPDCAIKLLRGLARLQKLSKAQIIARLVSMNLKLTEEQIARITY